MTLALDTSTLRSVRLRIEGGGKIRRLRADRHADRALAMIIPIVRRARPGRLAVVHTTGAWSATRTGVALANALAYAWRIPLAPITRDDFDSDVALPRGSRRPVAVAYDAPPTITTPRRK